MKTNGYPMSWEPKPQWDKQHHERYQTKTKNQSLAEFLGNQFFLGFQDQISRWDSLVKSSGSTFPPYNLLKLDDDHYTVEIALAGYSKDDIEITVEKDLLTVKSVETHESKEATVLHQGIARRLWTQKFVLGEWMIVKEATLKDGLLTIRVERELPEEAKPKVIKIK